MIRISVALAVVLLVLPAQATAAELKIVPAEVTLTGPYSQQRLVVLATDGGKVVRDLTGKAEITSSNLHVARVDRGPLVKPIADGEAVITADVDGQKATALVKVKAVKNPVAWSFRNHIIPVLTKVGCNSGACHGALAGKGGLKLSLRGYAPVADHFVLTRQAGGRRVNLLEPAQSLMLRKPTLAVPHGGGLRLELDSPEFAVLADWIASGCPGPQAGDSVIERLEVFPAEAVLKPKAKLQVVVRARYSDGNSADVTHLAKFASTEDLVAAVDDNGLVRVTGHGEAAITVWYSNLVTLCQVSSPMTKDVDPKVFAAAPRNNFIDDLGLKKLKALRIPPSPGCTDREFIRRAFLDAAGILPTAAELEKFLADSRPDRRSRLIDALLQRPEFVDYWAYRWSDMFLVSSRKLPQSGVWSFYQFIRQSVADNKPWDQFAREVLTAQGSSLDNGAVNYFVMHKDVAELTETTAVTFLGMSVTCCRCHNHPLEKWTQDNYWELANLFARVGIRNGDRGGEVMVQSQPDGEVLHPRRGKAMPPTPLDGKPLALDSSADRRKYFADWLTSRDNPYFARAFVNRIWRNFMGRGLIEAEDDLRQTNPPSNVELLDALAKDFVDHKFDVKHLVRTIMNSATYQRSSVPLPGNAADDRYYAHYLVRRLTAEVVLDAYSQVTGVPTVFNQVALGSTGGVADTKAYPPGTRALQLPDALVVSEFLDSFGRPDRTQPCSCERGQESSVTQALHLNNGKTLNDKLRAKSSRLEQWVKEKVNDQEAIRRLFVAALSREPTEAERTRLQALMAEAAREPGATHREVLEDLFWSVLTGREFLFNH
jgi:hypothetical protein